MQVVPSYTPAVTHEDCVHSGGLLVMTDRGSCAAGRHRYNEGRVCGTKTASSDSLGKSTGQAALLSSRFEGRDPDHPFEAPSALSVSVHSHVSLYKNGEKRWKGRRRARGSGSDGPRTSTPLTAARCHHLVGNLDIPSLILGGSPYPCFTGISSTLDERQSCLGL